MWIKTESILVPAYANKTTEVSVNEWFFKNRSFLLGAPLTLPFLEKGGFTHHARNLAIAF